MLSQTPASNRMKLESTGERMARGHVNIADDIISIPSSSKSSSKSRSSSSSSSSLSPATIFDPFCKIRHPQNLLLTMAT
ncbi:hypothetical protein Mapa_014782 [Marchantia paleacea]|nr:hypothetical protein Mapa_014782 [Marchantia paleacea]